MRVLKISVVVLFLLVSSSAVAMYRAASFVVVPVAASTLGLNGSDWHSDLEIMNVDTDAIDVEIVLLPSGGASNKEWYLAMSNALGGRTDDGFGHVDEKLKDIQPGRAVVLEDVVKATWGDDYKGALLIWAYKAGTFLTTTPQGGEPRSIVASSRVYTRTKNVDNANLTQGQNVPGLPWYYYVDPYLKPKGLDHVVFSGITEDASYRSSLGFVNISDPLTTLYVKATLKKADGTVLAEGVDTLEPLAHLQYDKFLDTFFGKATTETVVNGTLTLAVSSWESTGANPKPALMAYVSKIDNLTNDGINREQSYEPVFPWDCVFNGLNCPTPLPTTTPSASRGLGSPAGRAFPYLRPPVPGMLLK